ncbi:Lipoyl synthase [subsurface metagenome]
MNRKKLPYWLKKKIPNMKAIEEMEKILRDHGLHTVCESALCPNLGECFHRKTVTFMILGNICTRNCRFCAVEKGKPLPVYRDEPKNIAKVANLLKLSHVVITSVTRDDLVDGGANQFADCIKEIRKLESAPSIEVLIPDFSGNFKNLNIVLAYFPDVLNHNVETVKRLYLEIRPGADYIRSLRILKKAKKYSKNIIVKSGFMVGLGEKWEEIVSLLKDLSGVNCDIVTIGQYLQPSENHIPIDKFYTPDEFINLKQIALEMGIKYVESGPFVRSSYKASDALKYLKNSKFQ